MKMSCRSGSPPKLPAAVGSSMEPAGLTGSEAKVRSHSLILGWLCTSRSHANCSGDRTCSEQLESACSRGIESDGRS
uniref:Uncharacterized protein n=1 Tax=Arundo donax TaxID=35708 RepID=A0A0A9GPR5_ARUDO